jgi:hypothetical protein
MKVPVAIDLVQACFDPVPPRLDCRTESNLKTSTYPPVTFRETGRLSIVAVDVALQ